MVSSNMSSVSTLNCCLEGILRPHPSNVLATEWIWTRIHIVRTRSTEHDVPTWSQSNTLSSFATCQTPALISVYSKYGGWQRGYPNKVTRRCANGCNVIRISLVPWRISSAQKRYVFIAT